MRIQAGPDIANKICPYCQNRIGLGTNTIVCEGVCRMPHHAECWDYNGGCTTFGCPFAPGADRAPANQSMTSEDDLGIVLFPNADAVTGASPPAYLQQDAGFAEPRPQVPYSGAGSSRSTAWLWAALAAGILVLLIGVALTMGAHNRPTPAAPVPPSTPAIPGSATAGGTAAGTANAGSAALSYLVRGCRFLGIGSPGNEVGDIMLEAMEGNTRALDDADRCFQACIAQASVMRSDERVAETGATKGQITAQAQMALALTACIRVDAAKIAGNRSVARLWANNAYSYIRQAESSDPSIDTGPAKRMLAEMGY